jgi:hypothetical protein
MNTPKPVLIETHMNNFVPEGFTVLERISPTLFTGTGTLNSQADAMIDPRVKSLCFARVIPVKRSNFGAPPGAKKAEVKAAKRKAKPGQGK